MTTTRRHPEAKRPYRQPAKGKCRWCWGELPKRRQTFCSDQCVEEFKDECDWGHISRKVHKRDRGVCALCGCDTEKLRRIITWARRSAHWILKYPPYSSGELVNLRLALFGTKRGGLGFAEIDHIVQRAAGGSNALTNLRTLCIWCHADQTRQFVAQRAASRREESRLMKFPHTILAIDPATECGWAVRSPLGELVSGSWSLAVRSGVDGPGMRYVKFRRLLDGVRSSAPISLVVYEDVRRHLGAQAAHIYGGLVAHLQAWCEDQRITYMGIGVAAVKQCATGKGNAKKDAMIATAQARWPDQRVQDDNQADALWIAEAAFRQLAGPTEIAR